MPITILICLTTALVGIIARVFLRFSNPVAFLLGSSAGVVTYITFCESDHETFSGHWWLEMLSKSIVPAILIAVVWGVYTMVAA